MQVRREVSPMVAMWAGGLAALVLAAPVAASAVGRVAIDHAPLECVPYDRYTRIAATGAPSDGVAAAQLQFRSEGDGWYSVVMVAEGTEWSAFLPRPIRPLARLEYRIVMRSSDAAETETPVVAVPVRSQAECGSPSQSSAEVAAPIVVRVPEGAPIVPPVPAGFSPAGVVAAEDPVRSSLKTAAIGAGLGVGIAAGVLVSDDDVLPLEDLLASRQFVFSGMAPAPGSVLSFSRDRVSVFVDIRGRGAAPLTISWNFDLIRVGEQTVCAFMGGRTSVTSPPPTTVTLTGPLLPLAACGERFDVDRARLRVALGSQSSTQEVPASFHFEP